MIYLLLVSGQMSGVVSVGSSPRRSSFVEENFLVPITVDHRVRRETIPSSAAMPQPHDSALPK